MFKDDIQLLETNFPFWKHLNLDEKKYLIDNSSLVRYTKGSKIHAADNDCIGVVMIKKGQVRIFTLSEEGREITLYRLFLNDICILSASCIIDKITFDVHIDATEDTELILINAGSFNKLRENNMYVDNFTYKLTAHRFSDVMWTMEQILFMSMDKRLAIFLADEISKSNCDNIKFTHEEIAKFIGSSREVVTRMFKHFSTEGIVELSRGKIKVIDKAKLKSIIS